MIQRIGPTIVLAMMIASATILVGCDREKSPDTIVLVVMDTLRRDALSSYDGLTATPAIDGIAEGGQRLTNVVAAYFQTSMSMGALFTGRTPSVQATGETATLPWNGRTWCGMARFARSKDEVGCIPADVPTLAEGMRAAGYETLGIVSNVLLFAPSGMQRGFDDWNEVGRAAMHVNAAVAEALARRRGGPLFLYVHYMDVHDYDPVGLRRRREQAGIREHPAGVLGRGDHPAYAEAMARGEAAVAELLRILDEAAVGPDPLIVLTSDHGERIDERHLVKGLQKHRGNPAFEELLRIPLLASRPLVDDPEQLVRTQDIHHLLLAKAGVEPSAPQELEPDEVFLTEDHWRTYRHAGFKSFLDLRSGRLRLVDLTQDPREERDAKADHPEIAASHRRRIDELSRKLAVSPRQADVLTPEDEARLRALGYLD
jgi:arylsulfatase A-like enzyme